MKPIRKVLSIAGVCALAVLGGCNDFLDQVRYTSEVEQSQYYNTVEECNASTKVAYRFIDYSSWWETLNWRFLSGEASSDNGWLGNTSSPNAEYLEVGHFTLGPGNVRNEAHWIMLYKSIGRFNSMIEGITNAPIDEGSKTQFIAELKFLRSWCYFDLVRNWGGVPIVLKIYTPDVHLPRSTAQEVYAQIVADLREAASVLPKKSEYPSADKFRASKGAALTLLAKTYLYMEDWANAELAAKQVIDLGDYDLEASYGTLWGYNYRNGIESIFEIQNGSSVSPNLPYNDFQKMINAAPDGGWTWYSISSDLENAFKSEGDSVRLQWTINRHGLPVAGDPDKPKFNAGTPIQSKSGRYSRKHYIPVAQRPANGRPALNDKILRFADVLLIHAEACAMQNKTAEALASLKRVRDRVGLTTDMSLTGWDLINAVRKDRRLELAFEGDRLYDLRRWKDESGQPYINSVFGPDGSFVKYNTEVSTDSWEVNNLREPQDKGIHFNPAVHLLWPIPTSQIIASEGAVTQNPGYF
ncbi:MAG TPA: RagB/SusD family nutrient uptake outer membrane protein [Chryseosolibacter sp.]